MKETQSAPDPFILRRSPSSPAHARFHERPRDPQKRRCPRSRVSHPRGDGRWEEEEEERGEKA